MLIIVVTRVKNFVIIVQLAPFQCTDIGQMYYYVGFEVFVFNVLSCS